MITDDGKTDTWILLESTDEGGRILAAWEKLARVLFPGNDDAQVGAYRRSRIVADTQSDAQGKVILRSIRVQVEPRDYPSTTDLFVSARTLGELVEGVSEKLTRVAVERHAHIGYALRRLERAMEGA